MDFPADSRETIHLGKFQMAITFRVLGVRYFFDIWKYVLIEICSNPVCLGSSGDIGVTIVMKAAAITRGLI